MKMKPLTWKGWLAIGIIVVASFSLSLILFLPSSEIGKQLGTVRETNATVVQSTTTINEWINTWSPANSIEDYIALYFESGAAGLLCKKLTMSNADLATITGLDSMYTSTGQAKIVYVRSDSSETTAWLGLVFKDTDGSWRGTSIAVRDFITFDKVLSAVILRLGYNPLARSPFPV
jgi:hypothetical protein